MCRGVRGEPIRRHMDCSPPSSVILSDPLLGVGLVPLRLQPASRTPTDSAWSRKVSSFYEPPRRGTVGVLMEERLYTDRWRLTHICSPFRPGASQPQKLKARRIRRHLLYTTLHFTTALDASLHPVVTMWLHHNAWTNTNITEASVRDDKRIGVNVSQGISASKLRQSGVLMT
jgi:hypothetical protein